MKKQTSSKKEKVVLAYSGGLDTTTLIPWLKEHFDYDVICVCIDCGQEEELAGLDKKAKKAGASKTYIIDIQDELCNDFVGPCLKANATYENEYLLGTSLARPAIAKHLVEIAKKEKAVSICHGATGKGNDQIRFELAIKYLAPDIKVIAPWRMTDIWKMDSREDEIEWAAFITKCSQGIYLLKQMLILIVEIEISGTYHMKVLSLKIQQKVQIMKIFLSYQTLHKKLLTRKLNLK